MANTSPITPLQLQDVKTFPDLVRFVARFSNEAGQAINSILSTKTVWGAIGLSGAVIAGSSTFSCSLTATGSYFIAFRFPYSKRPAATFGGETLGLVRGASITTLGFFALTTTTAGVAANFPFSFIATGSR